MDLKRIAVRVAGATEYPRRIQIKSPNWEPFGKAYDEWEARHDRDKLSEEGVDVDVLLNEVTQQAFDLISETGCSPSEDDPGHDPDKLWVDCPDKKSFDSLVNLYQSARFKAKTSDPHWWLWTSWENHEITDVTSDDYEPEHLIRSEDYVPEGGFYPELRAIPGGKESSLRRAASSVASSPVRPRWAGQGDNIEELGMSAEYGQDEGMSSTHTQLENDDLENVDTRPKAGGPQCPHTRTLPGEAQCPECGGELIQLEGW